jgi:hypothetical protein
MSDLAATTLLCDEGASDVGLDDTHPRPASRPRIRRRQRLQASLTSGALLWVVGALAVVVAGCASMPSQTAGVATTSTSPVSTPAATVTPTPRLTPRPTVPPRPTPTPLPSPHYLTGNAYDFRDVLSDHQNFTCPDVDGAGQLLWTCSLGDQAIISFYGPSPAKVSAIRVETPPGDPGDWMRAYASIPSTAVYYWIDRRVQTDSLANETENLGGVWVQTTHDARSDVLLMSTKPLRP